MHKLLSYPSHLQNWAPVKHRRTHEDHAVAGDGSRGGVVNVVRLKDDLAVGSHGNPITIGEGQRAVIIQHRVQILNPDGINWPIQNNPNVLTWDKYSEKKHTVFMFVMLRK